MINSYLKLSRDPLYCCCAILTNKKTNVINRCNHRHTHVSTALREPIYQTKMPLADSDAEAMSSLLWRIRREREDRQAEELAAERRLRRVRMSGVGRLGSRAQELNDSDGDDEDEIGDDL